MLSASGNPRQIQLTNDGEPSVVLREREMGFTLGNRTFKISRSGTVSSVFNLTSEDSPLATLEQVPFRNRYTLSFGGEEWGFQSASLTDTKFSLERGGERVGSISAKYFARYKYIAIDLPDRLPLEVKAFLMWVVLWRWRSHDSG
jgi:hypothetical protein